MPRDESTSAESSVWTGQSGRPDSSGPSFHKLLRSDTTCLPSLEEALPKVMAHQPQCVFHLAGADPYGEDRLGGLRLTVHGLRQRDRTVILVARRADVPPVITLAGGYARRVQDAVAIHAATIEAAARQFTA